MLEFHMISSFYHLSKCAFLAYDFLVVSSALICFSLFKLSQHLKSVALFYFGIQSVSLTSNGTRKF